MISLLVTLLIIVLVAGVVFWIISLIPIPEPWGRIAQVIVGVIFLIVLLTYLLPLAHSPTLH